MGYTKKEYIDKFGEEAYQKYVERAREYYRVNKEKVLEQKKEYWNVIKDSRKEYKKVYYQNNKEELSKYYKKYRYKHLTEIKIRKKKNRNTKSGRAYNLFASYIYYDKKRNLSIDNNITKDWIIDNIFNSSCIYCGDSDWTHLGADRIDNSKPHTPENCVCACGICNIERSDKYSVEEFKKYRALHPRACDVPKGSTILLSETGALKKRAID